MPVSIRKMGKRFQVRTPSHVHAFGTTKKKAEAQGRLLNAVDHGWKPGHRRHESLDVLLPDPDTFVFERDDIGKLGMSRAGRTYARMSGPRFASGNAKEQAYIRMVSQEVGHKPKDPFRPEVVGKTVMGREATGPGRAAMGSSQGAGSGGVHRIK